MEHPLKETQVADMAAAAPEDNLYQHIERAEAIRQQLATLADAYLHETRTIEALENQLRAQRGEQPLYNDLNHALLRVTSVDHRALPTPRAYPN